MKRLLSPWHTLSALAVAGVLSACEPAAPPMPKAANTPTAAPSGQPAPNAGAVQGLSGDAALVAQSAQQAEALPNHAQLDTSASPLSALKPYVGTYPSDSNVSFLEQGVLAERLKSLLGKDYPTLLSNLRTVSPLREEGGRWFITGNRPHEGGMEAAVVVVDAAQNGVRVWMLHEGKVSEFADPLSASIPWPPDVQTMVDNHKASSAGNG